jgi:hypothetical protein
MAMEDYSMSFRLDHMVKCHKMVAGKMQEGGDSYRMTGKLVELVQPFAVSGIYLSRIALRMIQFAGLKPRQLRLSMRSVVHIAIMNVEALTPRSNYSTHLIVYR